MMKFPFWPAMALVSIVVQGYLIWDAFFPKTTVLYAVQSENCSGDDKETRYFFSMGIAAEEARASTLICDDVALAKMSIRKDQVDVHQYFDWHRDKDATAQLSPSGWR